QEVLPATLTLESGEGYDVEESSHQRLKSTLELLPVETLKLLYNSEDDDSQGNNVWGKCDVSFGGRLFEKGFEKRSNVNEGDAKTQDWENSDLQFLALERSLEKSIQASLEKAVDEIRKSIKQPGQPGFVPGGIPTYG
ncbi:18260_t:CDS:2, partial [Gigaspora rosea]